MDKKLTNAEFAATVNDFREACDRVKIPPTKRQASKWRRCRGLAYSKGR